jgi:glycosyltransferase involved in cell wall biosynthesis
VHDLSYVRLPECFPAALKRYLDREVPRSLERADLVLADAESTKRDLVGIYQVPPERVGVLYSGVNARFCPQVDQANKARVREKYRLEHPYLLSVSTIQPRKNYVRLIKAFSRLVADLPSPISLVIAGGNGWMYKEVYQTVEQMGLQDRVSILGFAPDDDLPALYSMATLFVYPSLYEGFGLPVAEAMACGLPVVCSNASSLPEVGGDAVLYFDPCDVGAMADAMRRALADEALRKELQRKGLEQVKRFSWERAAEGLLESLQGKDGHSSGVRKHG